MTRHRIALVGAGWWATTHHLPALTGSGAATVVAVVDPRLEHARAVADQFGVAAVFASVDELIAAGIADAAVVATPHSTHYAAVSSLLEAGLPVLVEKPLATTAADAEALVALASERGLLLAVGYTAQYAPAATTARTWVREEIGELVQVIVEFSSRAGSLFAATAADDASSSYSAATGSGQASTQLTHAISALLWTTGDSVIRLAALTNNRGLAVDVENGVLFQLAGGAIGTAAASGALGEGAPLRQRLRYIGTSGTVDHDLITGTAELQRSTGELLRQAAHHISHAYPADRPVLDFLELLDGGDRENAGDPVAAARTVAVIEAIHKSAATGAFVDVAPFTPTPRST